MIRTVSLSLMHSVRYYLDDFRLLSFVRGFVILSLTINLVGCSSVSDGDVGFEQLSGTTWEMVTMNVNGSTVSGVPNFFDLKFDADNASGRSDCNFWSAQYSAEPSGPFSLGQIASTKIACQPGSVEEQYFDALTRIDMHRAEKGNLVLLAPNGDKIEYKPID